MKSFLLYSLFAVFLWGCGQSTSSEEEKSSEDNGMLSSDVVENPSSKDNADTTNIPKMTFLEKEYEFGTVVAGKDVKHKFKFVNTGKTDLVIQKASPSCGCTVPDYPTDPVAPGDTGTVDVVFSTKGKSGFQNKSVTFVTNSIPNKTTIYLKGELKKAKEKSS